MLLAKIVSGVPIIKVAADGNRAEGKKARVEDAMHATKASLEEGLQLGFLRHRDAVLGYSGRANFLSRITLGPRGPM